MLASKHETSFYPQQGEIFTCGDVQRTPLTVTFPSKISSSDVLLDATIIRGDGIREISKSGIPQMEIRGDGIISDGFGCLPPAAARTLLKR